MDIFRYKVKPNNLSPGVEEKGFAFLDSYEIMYGEDGVYYKVNLIGEGERMLAYDFTPKAENHSYGEQQVVVYVRLKRNESGTIEILNILPSTDKKLLDKDTHKPKCPLTEEDFKMEIPKTKINDLKLNSTMPITLLLLSSKVKQGKAKPYIELTLSDKQRTISAKDFNATTLEGYIPNNTVVDVILKLNEYGYTADNIEISRNTDISAFVKRPPVKEAEMYDDIVGKLRDASHGNANSICMLAIDLYDQNKDKLLMWSASKTMHHDMRGGLLYHTYRMMQCAVAILKVYAPMDEEILLSSVALHDIGKLKELDTTPAGVASYTTDGELFGHLEIGVQMIAKASAGHSYDEEKLKLLEHCVASHHGTQEFGAIVVPKIKEAFVLNMIDNMDAKVYMFDASYSELEPGTSADRTKFGLDGKVYRPKFTEGTEYDKDWTN